MNPARRTLNEVHHGDTEGAEGENHRETEGQRYRDFLTRNIRNKRNTRKGKGSIFFRVFRLFRVFRVKKSLYLCPSVISPLRASVVNLYAR